VILPLFKSHFSIGKSILTLDSPAIDPNTKNPDSIFDIAEDYSLDRIIRVEDSFMGFLQARKVCFDLNKQLIFGLRLDMCDDLSKSIDPKDIKCSHKVILFPKNSDGCKLLNKIYTECKTKHNGWMDFNFLQSFWDEDCLKLCIPFYDSFIFKNLTTFQSCFAHFTFTAPTFFIESNSLPFDAMTQDAVIKYCDSHGFQTESTQSIFYKNKQDFSAYLTYKLICGRSSFAGRDLSLEKPNFDHLGSDEFCWESYLEKNNLTTV
jgi:hypothetical protein